MCLADVTDIPQARLEDEVVLLGGSGEERISAETLAAWAGTINYEVVTRISPSAGTPGGGRSLRLRDGFHSRPTYTLMYCSRS